MFSVIFIPICKVNSWQQAMIVPLPPSLLFPVFLGLGAVVKLALSELVVGFTTGKYYLVGLDFCTAISP
jgi:hypothetical protein